MTVANQNCIYEADEIRIILTALRLSKAKLLAARIAAENLDVKTRNYF
jgi:hypothetical protein